MVPSRVLVSLVLHNCCYLSVGYCLSVIIYLLLSICYYLSVIIHLLLLVGYYFIFMTLMTDFYFQEISLLQMI